MECTRCYGRGEKVDIRRGCDVGYIKCDYCDGEGYVDDNLTPTLVGRCDLDKHPDPYEGLHLTEEEVSALCRFPKPPNDKYDYDDFSTSGSVNTSMDLSREEIYQKGLERPYEKFINFPISTTDKQLCYGIDCDCISCKVTKLLSINTNSETLLMNTMRDIVKYGPYIPEPDLCGDCDGDGCSSCDYTGEL